MNNLKLWIDDVIPAPERYVWCKSISEAKHRIRRSCEELICNKLDYYVIEIIDIDHNGGNYIKFLDWLEQTGRNYPIRIHSQNSVGGN